MKILITILLIVSSFALTAQKRQVQNLPDFDYKLMHFGFTVGTNIMTFGIIKDDSFFNESEFKQIYSIEYQTNAGFLLGPVSDLHLGEYFDLRLLINLSFGQRNLKYLMVEDTTTKNPILTTHTMKIASTFIEFPLLIKYKSMRLNNMRVYLISGINPRIDMAHQSKIGENQISNLKLKKYDLAYEIGCGLDIYLPYFKFSPELKYSHGLYNMITRDETQFTKSIKRLNSNIWLLSFHFEGSF